MVIMFLSFKNYKNVQHTCTGYDRTKHLLNQEAKVHLYNIFQAQWQLKTSTKRLLTYITQQIILVLALQFAETLGAFFNS